jgi:hypothetical protein
MRMLAIGGDDDTDLLPARLVPADADRFEACAADRKIDAEGLRRGHEVGRGPGGWLRRALDVALDVSVAPASDLRDGDGYAEAVLAGGASPTAS